MNKKVIITIFSLAFLALIILCRIRLYNVFAAFTKEIPYTERIQADWNITLPENAEFLHTAVEESFHNDGYCYYLIQLDSGQEDTQHFLSAFQRTPDKDAVLFYQEAVKKLHLTGDQRFTVSPDCLWSFLETDYSQMYMLYDPVTGRLCLAGYSS